MQRRQDLPAPAVTEVVAPTAVAAAGPLADLLTGPLVAARVVASGRFAAHLVVPRPGLAAPRLVSVVVPGAVVPPCAVVLPDGVDPSVLLPAGTPVHVGDGAVAAPGARLVVGRWWQPGRLPGGAPDPTAVDAASRALAAVLPHADPVTADLAGRARALGVAAPAAAALAAGDPGTGERLLTSVLGLGPGSTPTGDDVAAGVLLAARALEAGTPADRDAVAAGVLRAAATRTGAVSAGLLAEAAAGRASGPVLDLLRALLAPADPAVAVDALRRLLEVGHTSGADLATGLLAVAGAAPSSLSVPRSRGTAVPPPGRRPSAPWRESA